MGPFEDDPFLTQQDRAYQQLRADILHGDIGPSTKIQISELKDKYATSIGPIREAVSRLAAEELVVKRGQRGYWVAPVSLAEFQSINRLRTMLEVDALRLSILNGDLDWEARVVGAMHRLTSIETQLTKRNRKSCAKQIVEENVRFHLTLIDCCGSEWQMRFVGTLYDHTQRYWRLSVLTRKDEEELNIQKGDHEKILSAALARNLDEACRALTDHIAKSAQSVIAAIFPKGTAHAEPVLRRLSVVSSRIRPRMAE